MMNLTVTGNLGADAELKTTPKGDTVCEFRVASSAGRKGSESTTWVRCALWGKRGEGLAQYLTKGTPVCVVGEMSVREYTSQGATKFSLEVRVHDVALQGGKRNDAPRSANPHAKQPGWPSENSTGGYEGDEIPF